MNDHFKMTEREQLLCMISDDYKTLYGFRPRNIREDITVEELRAWHSEICESIKREMEYEQAEETAHEEAMAAAFVKKPWTIGEILILS
jgi:hypothetical protein